MRTRSKKKPKKNGPPLESKVSNISYFRVLVVIPKTVTWITFLDNLCGILELEWYRLLNFFRIENFFISLTVFSAASFLSLKEMDLWFSNPKSIPSFQLIEWAIHFWANYFNIFPWNFSFIIETDVNCTLELLNQCTIMYSYSKHFIEIGRRTRLSPRHLPTIECWYWQFNW
jgi:hypothetical protein